MTKILKIQSVGGLLVNCFVLIKTHTVAVVNKCFSILPGFLSIHWLLHDDFCICTLQLLMFFAEIMEC